VGVIGGAVGAVDGLLLVKCSGKNPLVFLGFGLFGGPRVIFVFRIGSWVITLAMDE